MIQSIFFACLPWAVCLVVAVIIGRILIMACGARLNLGRLRTLHRCESGSVQSLSFVLTLPFFLMIIMLIVQVSHIMIANVVVHYAAFASVRSAVVWIPANAVIDEEENRISSFQNIGGDQYRVSPEGAKYSKIKQAAVLAVCSLGPSRDLGYTLDDEGTRTGIAFAKLYRALDAESQANSLINRRLRNKLAYSYENTDVDITFRHPAGPFSNYQDPPLGVTYEKAPYVDEFYDNEVGWQDHVTSTVTYNLPLLPGPVRLFAPAARRSDVSKTDSSGEAYVFTIAASASMMNEGEKPVFSVPYWQEEFFDGASND